MKKETRVLTIIFTLSLFLGVSSSLIWRTPMQGNHEGLSSRQTLNLLNSEVNLLNKQEKNLAGLNKSYTKMKKQYDIEKNILSTEEAKLYKKLRTILGEYNLVGEGIIIKIASIDEEHNIAFEFDSARTLLKIVNFSRQNGAESMAINSQFLSNHTGIVLAGNHININDTPISPPYEIKIIGNEKRLYRYFNDESVFMMSLKNNKNLKINIEKSRKITIPMIKAYAKLEYLQEKK